MRVKKTKTPVEGSENLKRAFELGYLAAVLRLRRELPSAWRDGVMGALTGEIVDRERLAEQAGIDRQYSTHVRGVRLIVLRCEAAATLMSWRKELPEKASVALRAAVKKLIAEAQRLGIA